MPLYDARRRTFGRAASCDAQFGVTLMELLLVLALLVIAGSLAIPAITVGGSSGGEKDERIDGPKA